ncbi:MAG: cadherin repeat domain-containing protein, partial [Thiolinea sp.]
MTGTQNVRQSHSQLAFTLLILFASLLLFSGSAFANQYIVYESDNTYPTQGNLDLTGMALNQEITVATDNYNSIRTTDDTPSNINSGRKFHCNDSSPAMSGGLIASGNPDYRFRFYYGSTQITCAVGASPFFYSYVSGNHTDSIVPMYLKLVKVADSGSTASITYPNFQLCSRDPSTPDNATGCWRGHNDGLSRYYPASSPSTVTIITNNAPTITSASSTDFAENGTGTVIDVQATDDTDSEGSGLTYTFTGSGADDALFNISSTGAITFKTTPDYEAPDDNGGDNTYNIQVRVCDSESACTTQAITINVTDEPEAAPASPDTDGDGVPDGIDVDDDNDGILDVNEGASADAEYIIPDAYSAGDLTATGNLCSGVMSLTMEDGAGSSDAILATPGSASGMTAFTDAAVFDPAAATATQGFVINTGAMGGVGARRKVTVDLGTTVTNPVIHLGDIDKTGLDFAPYAATNGLTSIAKVSG